MYKLENWCVTIDNPYLPPEVVRIHASGKVYGNPKFPDGDEVTTSAIVAVEGRVITTETDSKYELGEPDPEYVKYCKEKGCHVPTPEEPIKIRRS